MLVAVAYIVVLAKKLILVKHLIPSERAFQGEQNGANFSSIIPSSEEL